jgi:hypothetical protein
MFEPIGKDFTKFFVCKKEEAQSEAMAVEESCAQIASLVARGAGAERV